MSSQMLMTVTNGAKAGLSLTRRRVYSLFRMIIVISGLFALMPMNANAACTSIFFSVALNGSTIDGGGVVNTSEARSGVTLTAQCSIGNGTINTSTLYWTASGAVRLEPVAGQPASRLVVPMPVGNGAVNASYYEGGTVKAYDSPGSFYLGTKNFRVFDDVNTVKGIGISWQYNFSNGGRFYINKGTYSHALYAVNQDNTTTFLSSGDTNVTWSATTSGGASINGTGSPGILNTLSISSNQEIAVTGTYNYIHPAYTYLKATYSGSPTYPFRARAVLPTLGIGCSVCTAIPENKSVATTANAAIVWVDSATLAPTGSSTPISATTWSVTDTAGAATPYATIAATGVVTTKSVVGIAPVIKVNTTYNVASAFSYYPDYPSVTQYLNFTITDNEKLLGSTRNRVGEKTGFHSRASL